MPASSMDEQTIPSRTIGTLP
ncbi:hypothetical protein LINPERPRIM_LOCUS32901 [Linum perenne]